MRVIQCVRCKKKIDNKTAPFFLYTEGSKLIILCRECGCSGMLKFLRLREKDVENLPKVKITKSGNVKLTYTDYPEIFY